MLSFKIRNGTRLTLQSDEVVSAGTTDLYAEFEAGELFNGPLTAFLTSLAGPRLRILCSW